MTTAELDWELEDAAEAMASPLRGQAGRFPARHLPAHLRRQGFLVTRHFLDRLIERAQAQGVRFDPRSFREEFRRAQHFRQTRPGYNTRIALMQGLPVLYRMGGWRGLNPVLVGLLPQGPLPPAKPVRPPLLREADFEQELVLAASELEFGGRGAPRVLTYTTKDVIDNRISVPAQHSLVRLSKDPATAADAVGMLEAVKAGRLAGIYCVNWQKSAQRALRLGKSWWTVIPKGEDAVLMLDPDNPLGGQPLIAFRRELDPDCGLLKGEKRFVASPGRLDAALQKASQTFDLLRTGQLSRCDVPPPIAPAALGASIEAETAVAPLANIFPPILCQLRRRRPRRPVPPPPGVDLVVDSPQPNERFFIHPGNFPATGPSMPAVKVLGRMLAGGQPIPDARITWEFKISGNYRVRSRAGNRCGTVRNCRLQNYVFTLGQVVTVSGQRDFIEFGMLTKLIVGGNLEIKATARDAAGRTVTRTVRCQVLGQNPARAQVEALITAQVAPDGALAGPCGDDSWALIRIFCHESAHNLAQFRGDGSVLFGPPAGVGITQRDPEVSEWRFPTNRETAPNNFFPRIFWNWQENVREGIRVFRSKMALANADLRRLQVVARRERRQLPAFCVGVLMRAAIRRYNGGTEYALGRRGRNRAVYEVRPSTSAGREGYVDQVLGDHSHPNVALPAIPAVATHVQNQQFGAADQPCQVCNLP